MAWKYASELDDKEALLALLGSFWSRTYEGRAVPLSLADATAQGYAQAQFDLLDLVASSSRYRIPAFHTENWYLLTLRESVAMNTTAVAAYDDAGVAYDGLLSYDTPTVHTYWIWPLPPGLTAVPLLVNRITGTSVTLVENVDYVVSGGNIIFRENPLANDLVPRRPLLVNNTVVDNECALWVCRGQFDWQNVASQFGYAIDLVLKSSENYKALVNAVFDALIFGTTASQLHAAWSAITGVPLAAGNETVQAIYDESYRKLVVTDKNVYVIGAAAAVTVAVSDALQAGQSLCDALNIYEFNRGQVPTLSQVAAVALGKGFLAAGYFQDLVFENKDVPLVVTSDADGYTRLSWHLGGFPGDVEKFFDELHARGRAAGQTLTNLLDLRPAAAQTTEPVAASLPATINPFAFLCQNVLRNNAFLVAVRPQAFGKDACGLAAAKILRKIVPPQTAMLVLATLEYTDVPLIMEAAGTDTAPGYTESARIYLGATVTETLGPAWINEQVRCKIVGGHCI